MTGEALLFVAGPPLIGLTLDFILGDPVWLIHPVRLMGRLIETAELSLRRKIPPTPEAERAAGLQLAALCVLVTYLSYRLIEIAAARRFGGWGLFLAECWIFYRLTAAGELRRSALRVFRPLRENRLDEAKKKLSEIVGRDVLHLDEAGVIRASVETVAENASDGVIAPMLYLCAGGIALGAAYKMINTLDSMVGYKNERYLNLGRASARLDDIAGLVPARLSAWLLIAGSFFCGLDTASSLRIWRRDRKNHTSPNSAQGEAACAGALGIRLGGPSRYRGAVLQKPFIGDSARDPAPEDILRATRLMAVASVLALPLCVAVRFIAYIFLRG
ncbi:MAG: adenosylcobinamide-phosphate synthase CbiB [Oscillospiraceae bacterium]|nr:adenosylcobinamide-phosphate synthase CbiB [Oscillospiraceae bacterium]